MFDGFDRSALDFFMALQFNNNREFFRDNHDWYAKSVRTPLVELCMALAPGMLKLDADLEVRPARAVSHINRDLRYSRDKSPYRSYMWLGFHRAGIDKRDSVHLYFDIGADGGHFGMGMYGADRAWTDGVRRLMVEDGARMVRVLEGARAAGFELHADQYRRIKPPDELDERLGGWYACRSFYIERALSSRELGTGELVNTLLCGFGALKPAYDMMYEVRPDRSAVAAGPSRQSPHEQYPC